MASPPTLDFDALLQPISEDVPAGISLKDDPATQSLYYQVKDAREAARTAERVRAKEEEGAGGDRPDWAVVVRLATEVIQSKSKDLWIAAWLVEGLTREHGFAGVRDGFRLVRELSERYFDGVHPRPDEDGVATTVAQLAGLNGEGGDGALIGPIAAIPITQGASIGPFTGHDYADAERVARIADPEVRARRTAAGAPTLDMLQAAAAETPTGYYVELREDVAAAAEEFAKMTAVLDEKCGKDAGGYSLAPPSSQISTALADSLERVRHLSGEPEAAADEDDAEQAATAAGGGSADKQRVSSREEAFQQLLKVAEYFRKTEPHSPVSYSLEQAVRWGRMPLPELIRELVADESVRRELFRRTGMRLENEE